MPDLDRLDPIRRLVVDRARECNLTMADLSRVVRKNETYMHQYVYKGTPKRLSGAVRALLAKALEVEEVRLRAPGDDPLPEPGAPRFPGPLGAPAADVPVFLDTDEIDLSRARQFAPRPQLLMGQPDAFALYVSRPAGRLEPGDLAYVHSRPARRGDLVVALKDQRIAAMGVLTELTASHATVGEAGSIPIDSSNVRILRVATITLA